MKSFIISLGIILIGVSALVFQTDFYQYILIDENLQNLTEECACYGAWALDATDEGIRINSEKAKANINTLVSYASSHMPCFSNGTIEFDEQNMRINEYWDASNDKLIQNITVKLSYISNEPFFRQAFAPKHNKISWESAYEWR